jgi:trans-aconitate 2-methyltransferase
LVQDPPVPDTIVSVASLPQRRENPKMTDWNAAQYLKFEDERTRPSADLLARVPIERAGRCMDLGCGPGNSTELLVNRFPDAAVSGLDSSPAMIAAARERLPAIAFEVAEIATWRPRERFDLIFANAVLQWVPDHRTELQRLAGFLERGGCLAVQMPNNLDEPSERLTREVAAEERWADKLASSTAAREQIATFDDYYDLLSAAGCTADIWQTTYVHALDGPEAIVEWFKGTALRPFVDPLQGEERSAFLSRYQAKIAEAYPVQRDGKVLLRFPRLFFVAQRR